MPNEKTAWLNLQKWQVSPVETTDKETGKKKDAYRITLQTPDSADNYGSIIVDKVIQKAGDRFSVPLDADKIYSMRVCKRIIPEAQVDKNGEPVINEKTGKQYDAKEFKYISITGEAIKEQDDKRREAYYEQHPDKRPVSKDAQTAEKPAVEAPAVPEGDVRIEDFDQEGLDDFDL